jgi:quinol monooxygenase YgiN
VIIVSGRIHVRPGRREAFLAASRDAIVAARRAPGCGDFIVAADPIEPERVNVYEEWESDATLEAFRDAGPDAALMSDIVGARHRVSGSGPA